MLTLKEQCDRLYMSEIPDVPAFERAIVEQTFLGYDETDKAAVPLFLPEEVPYSSGYIKRGVTERRIAENVMPLFGGVRIPSFTKGRTSHYSVFQIGTLDFTVSCTHDSSQGPRQADFRTARFETVRIAFPFDEAKAASRDARVPVLLKHGRDDIDSTVPQFLRFEVYDLDGTLLWKRDLLVEQRKLVRGLLIVREEQNRDDKGVAKLRQHLRSFENEA